MKVCIDARSISHPRRGGFKTYIENLVSALLVLDDETEYVLVYDRPYSLPHAGRNERVHEAVIPAQVPLLGQGYREQIGIPRFASRSAAACWHFPYNTAPALGAPPYVLTLHDMTAFTHSPVVDWSAPVRAIKDLAMYAYPRALIPQAARHAAAIITVSEYARSRIIELLNVAPEKVVVTPLAAAPLFRRLPDDERDRARDFIRTRFGVGKPFVLSVASTLLKNPIGVLEAYAQLAPRLRDEYDLVIVMAHEQARAAVDARIAALSLDLNTHVIIAATPSDLLMLYNCAEVLLYPSFTESFPLPTMEAMVCGLPVICSNTTGFPEQVGTAAITVDPGSVEEVASALARVLGSTQERAEMSERSVQRSSAYSWVRTARETRLVYARVGHLQ